MGLQVLAVAAVYDRRTPRRQRQKPPLKEFSKKENFRELRFPDPVVAYVKTNFGKAAAASKPFQAELVVGLLRGRFNTKTFLIYAALVTGLVSVIANVAHAQTGSRPAMITSGGDSVAAHFHYPPKAKAAKVQAAIPFYCEVGADGKPAHLQLFGPTDNVEFRIALLKALTKGRFQPAMSGGKTVPVMLGGTAFFMFNGNEPVIVISLSTADKEKTAALSNYIQPQMLASSAEFRRKLWKARFDPDIHLRRGVHPGAVVVAQIDAQGNLLSTKIIAETPPDSGWGPLLVKGFQGAKFIPALSDGKPVPGQFDLIANYEYVYNPDYGAPTGSLIKRDDYER